MLVTTAFFDGDIEATIRLYRWVHKLGQNKAHSCLLVADPNTPFDQTMQLREIAESIFNEVRVITLPHTSRGWPDSANLAFKTAATYVHEKWAQPFLWVEADCVPLKPGWLDDIARDYEKYSAYREFGMRFMGFKYRCEQPFLPELMMSGVCCYPEDAIVQLPDLPQSPRAWDVDGAEVMTKNGFDSKLFHHVWGQPNLPPTFVAQKTIQSSVNAMTPEDIPLEAVLFHRNKDGSLQRLLERKLFPQEFKHPIVVCFNVHAGDVNLALYHSQWLRTMARGHHWQYKAIICHDPSCPVTALNHFEQNLRHCFAEVGTCVYARPPIPQYPASANFAFQSVALFMAHGRSPWLWCEADAVALKPDWLDQLQAEYDRCGASWMGPVVPHMNHLQGTAIYPADAATRMPRAMACGAAQAFDMEAHHDTIHDRHDCSHLMFHTWSILNGQFCPVGGGAVPVSISLELAQTIPKTAVFAHRIKDESLVKLLLSGQYVH